ncbi:7354_t:CDS:2, partial [Scutellospora calospora]
DNITYSDTTRFGNRSRENRLSAPTPYRPKEYIVSTRPRPNSQIILPTSMQHYGSFAMPNSDQEFRMLARILNWPTQPGQSPVNQISGQVGNPLTKDNMVDDGEIIFDTSSIDQEGDIQQSKGQHPHKSQSTFYIPQERFSVAAAMRQMTKPLQAPEVPPLISANYGKEIFDQIKSDDDPRLIVWSISRAQEIKHGSTLSLSTNSSRRWSFHDYTFLTDFFLTYRKFITPIKLCKLLILRFDWALDGDDEKRRLVRVRTFVTIRHWILNYFAYDFIPCRTLRTTLTKYLNKLPSHRLVKNSPRDQRIVQGLKRVIRRLKRIYYRKSAIDYMDKGGDMSSIGSKKLGKKNNQGLNIIIDSGGGVGTSLIEEPTISYNSSNYNTVKEKQLNTIVNSESDVIDSYTPNIKETTQNIIYSSSSNSHTSDEDLSSKATHEFYDQK